MKWTQKECFPLAKKIYMVIIQNPLVIPDGKDVPASKLCGKDLWNKLDAGQRRFAGRFVSVCVRNGMFGLEQIRQDSSHHWRYRRSQATH